MDFPSALKKLAEIEPSKFAFDFFGRLVLDPTDEITRANFADLNFEEIGEDFTQDDIDEILALAGWEYEITGRMGGWGYSAWIMAGENSDSISTFSVKPTVLHPTKLLAAQAALIAVVQKLSEEKK